MTSALQYQTEAEFQSAVVEYARLCGWVTYHTHNSMFSEKGFPDLCMVRDGRLVFAELKAEGKWPDLPQQCFIGHLDQTCAEVYLWFPSDWDEIERVLR